MPSENESVQSDNVRAVIPAAFSMRICFYANVKWSRKRQGEKSAIHYLRSQGQSLIAWDICRNDIGDGRPLPITTKGVVDQPYVIIRPDNSLELPFFENQLDAEEFIAAMLDKADPKPAPKIESVGNGLDSLRTITLKRKA
jgi:hypothetical protein